MTMQHFLPGISLSYLVSMYVLHSIHMNQSIFIVFFVSPCLCVLCHVCFSFILFPELRVGPQLWQAQGCRYAIWQRMITDCSALHDISALLASTLFAPWVPCWASHYFKCAHAACLHALRFLGATLSLIPYSMPDIMPTLHRLTNLRMVLACRLFAQRKRCLFACSSLFGCPAGLHLFTQTLSVCTFSKLARFSLRGACWADTCTRAVCLHAVPSLGVVLRVSTERLASRCLLLGYSVGPARQL